MTSEKEISIVYRFLFADVFQSNSFERCIILFSWR